MRDDLAMRSRRSRSVSWVIVMAYGTPGFLRRASMMPVSIQ
jgi:hypothetical protein